MTDAGAPSEPSRVGVIGLGVMGGAIARHLRSHGYEVTGYDVAPAACAAARAAGVAVARSVGGLAGDVDAVITSLPSAAALGVVTEELIAAPRRPGRLVETSTLALDDKERVRSKLGAVGIAVLDCPISGTGHQMAAGDAVIYPSGDEDCYRSLATMLSAFARAAYFAGGFGNGTKLKFVANLLVSVHNVAAAEALALAERAGLDLPATLEALVAGAGGSRMLEVRGPAMLGRRYLPGAMRMGLFQKDLDLIGDYAAAVGAATPLFAAALTVYHEGLASGLVDEDTAAVFEVLSRREGGRDGGVADLPG